MGIGVDPISNSLGVSARLWQPCAEELMYPIDAVARGFPLCRTVATQRRGATTRDYCDGVKARTRVGA